MSIILKLSTPCIFRGNSFFSIPTKCTYVQYVQYIYIYIYIFITSYLLHVSVFFSPSSRRPLRYLLKKYILFAVLSHLMYILLCSCLTNLFLLLCLIVRLCTYCIFIYLLYVYIFIVCLCIP
jgi:putative flippase GtrA